MVERPVAFNRQVLHAEDQGEGVAGHGGVQERNLVAQQCLELFEAAGEGVDAAEALPVYLRDKVAFTKEELERRT